MEPDELAVEHRRPDRQRDLRSAGGVDTESIPAVPGRVVTHNDTYDVWTITMRQGETFHDGTVDAAAVRKDLEAIRTSVLTSAVRPGMRSRPGR